MRPGPGGYADSRALGASAAELGLLRFREVAAASTHIPAGVVVARFHQFELTVFDTVGAADKLGPGSSSHLLYRARVSHRLCEAPMHTSTCTLRQQGWSEPSTFADAPEDAYQAAN